jgi:branched-chain amino acid transport system substrate-binding protein
MKRNVSTHIAPSVLRSLERFGADIRIARLKRNLTAAHLASALQIHRSTLSRVEAGDPMVALGIYAGVLHALDLGTPFADAADPRRDEHGLLLDLQRLPQRARVDRRQAVRSPLVRRSAASDRTLRIGVLGVMSGPAAPWGTVNRHCAEITAEMYNDAGGIDIGGERFKIELRCFDDVLSASRAAEGARHLTEKEGVRYIIGPNVEQTMSAVLPIVERNRAMVFPYSFTRSLYRPPRGNAVLCQVAGYQAIPSIYRHLIRRQGVKTIALVAPATAEGLRQRQDASRIATSLGMRVVCESATYRVGADDLESAVEPAVARRPDILALPNVAPLDASRLIRRARDLGFRSLITTESAQDIEHLLSTLGADADGIVMVGGASLPESRSPRMDFIRRFVRRFGVWNDEAGTKAYALEFVLGTLQVAGRAALDDIGLFKAAIPHFAIDNPLAQTRASMAYVGAGEFQHKRQIGIPLVVNTIRKGQLETLFTQEPEEFLQ